MEPEIQTLLAGLPILVILVLMLGFRWSAASAGSAGLLLTVVLATLAFGFGTRVLPELGMTGALAGALAEAVFGAATILWIIFPALCIYELQQASGAITRIQNAIGNLSADPRLTALLIAWFFALFMEGAAGFGTAAALAAPFLVSMGFGKVESVTIVLIGHGIGVSFGAIGTPILPLVAASPFSALELSTSIAAYHGLLGLLMAFFVMLFINQAVPREVTLHRSVWFWTFAAAVLFLLPYYLIARYVGPELPTLGGALVGAGIFVAGLLLWRKHQGTDRARYQQPQGIGELARAGAPYLVLIGLILLTRLIPPIQGTLSSIVLQWQFTVFEGRVAYLYHPGTLLFISFIGGAWWQRKLLGSKMKAELAGAMSRALRRLVPVALALAAMLGLSRIMVHSQMIETLAISAAASAGSLWPLFAPFVGVLGTFVTGSATASNILFSEFQQASAERSGHSALALQGAQGFGAAIGNLIAPHNIIAASAVVGLSGKEGEVLRRTLHVTLVYTLLGGLLALFVFA
ncbi:MAG: L-lactate permease [Halomonadaceae bacterium]|nr:MAG: L-lactate permease [Halomonadaceae bacterium]